MSQTLGADFYKNNRLKLREIFGAETPIVLSANGLIQRSRDDDAYLFHQDSNFLYLTGLHEPDLILVMDDKNEFIILPEKDQRHLDFTGPIDKKKLAATSGISEILAEEDGFKKLAAVLNKTKRVASIRPSDIYSKTYNVYSNPSGRTLIKKIKKLSPGARLANIAPTLVDMRVIKQPAELKAIEKAINHSGKALQLISDNFDKMASESDIEAELAYYQAKNRLGSAFAPIVANGTNACTLHYQNNDSKLDKKQITLIDTGYIYGGYCSDITRVICKKPSKRHKAVYEAVVSIQEYAFSLLKPGVEPNEYEKSVAKFAGEKLQELGLIKKIDSESVHKYYKHRTSHFLGIDVHDDGDYSKKFEENMVITVEPGIYIAKENIGIRIEDNVVITKNGCKNLSNSISKNLESIRMVSV